VLAAHHTDIAFLGACDNLFLTADYMRLLFAEMVSGLRYAADAVATERPLLGDSAGHDRHEPAWFCFAGERASPAGGIENQPFAGGFSRRSRNASSKPSSV